MKFKIRNEEQQALEDTADVWLHVDNAGNLELRARTFKENGSDYILFITPKGQLCRPIISKESGFARNEEGRIAECRY